MRKNVLRYHRGRRTLEHLAIVFLFSGPSRFVAAAQCAGFMHVWAALKAVTLRAAWLRGSGLGLEQVGCEVVLGSILVIFLQTQVDYEAVFM